MDFFNIVPGQKLTQLDLRGKNFNGMYLGMVDFSGSNLSGASFRNADLAQARFVGCDLYGADFSKSSLNGTLFNYADAEGADFSRAVGTHTSFLNTDLKNSKFNWSSFDFPFVNGANFTGSVLDLISVYLGENGFGTANMSDTVFDRKKLERRIALAEEEGREPLILYRTKRSLYYGATSYRVGKTYKANAFSLSEAQECHPGIYGYDTLEALVARKLCGDFIKMSCPPGMWLNVADSIYRCAEVTIIEDVTWLEWYRARTNTLYTWD